MNTEEKQKAMLADDLLAYVNQKHTQEECIGFIDGYNAALNKLKLLGIGDVSKCSVFYSESNTTSATKCKFCGKEKFEH